MVKSYLGRYQPRLIMDAGELHDKARRAYRESAGRIVMIDIDAMPGWADREYVKRIGETLYGK